MSHHATEDLAIMRAIPNITIFSPSDPLEARAVTQAAYDIQGPCYIRLGKGGEENIHGDSSINTVLQAIKICDGERICIFSTGAISSEVKKVINFFDKKKINIGMYTFPCIKPIDEETIIECAKKYSVIFTVEEHNIMGGFGSSVSEVISEMAGNKAKLKRIGLKDIFSSIVGSQEYLREYYGISQEHIKEHIIQFLAEVKE